VGFSDPTRSQHALGHATLETLETPTRIQGHAPTLQEPQDRPASPPRGQESEQSTAMDEARAIISKRPARRTSASTTWTSEAQAASRRLDCGRGCRDEDERGQDVEEAENDGQRHAASRLRTQRAGLAEQGGPRLL